MKNKIVIIDYEVGNVLSVQRALATIGYDAVISRDKAVIDGAQILILPGVGAFEKAMQQLDHYGLVEPIRSHVAQKKLLVGICLGMQLLFETSSEFGHHKGLGVVKGHVELLLEAPEYKVPHIGWNKLLWKNDNFPGGAVDLNDWYYFVHSYATKGDTEGIVATSSYGANVIGAIVHVDNVVGFQFHPEKSGEAGMKLLAHFLQYA